MPHGLYGDVLLNVMQCFVFARAAGRTCMSSSAYAERLKLSCSCQPNSWHHYEYKRVQECGGRLTAMAEH